ncbi:MAG: UDP-N-acetylmuramate dehydrogenase [Deltaproteobacteria bacterium]|nr:UDP-N-acetylmuramate dehydrogenase [Deltaproteobacteria bacterium]
MKSIHLIGVAGTGMGAFAGLLKAAGYDVRGSDEGVYPPMSDKLREWGIAAKSPYGATNLEPAPDLVVVGNVVKRDNPEAAAMRERGLPHASFPATLGDLFLSKRRSVVVAGTHGKTTTTTLLAWTLLSAGRDPGFLVGGVPAPLGTDGRPHGMTESFRLGAPGEASPFVVEGDEYDTAYFDKGPKFLHYAPRSLLCTSLEYDHADIYADVDAIVARFAQLLSLVPPAERGGHVVLWASEPHLLRARAQANVVAPVTMYAAGRDEPGGAEADVVADRVVEDGAGLSFFIVVRGVDRGAFALPLSGRHNLLNALGAYAILAAATGGLGLSDDELRAGFASFPGVKRRMEARGEAAGVLVVDDFAHHPTAVRTTLAGARRRFAGRPLWAIFEPRSATSCRKVFQDDYARAFDAADRVVLAPPGRALDPSVALDVPRLAADLRAAGKDAVAAGSLEEVVDLVRAHAPRGAPGHGAVLLCMSNGAFGGVHDRLLAALRTTP